jgi:hypothetical protein
LCAGLKSGQKTRFVTAHLKVRPFKNEGAAKSAYI